MNPATTTPKTDGLPGAEQSAALPVNGKPTELVRGKIVDGPTPSHGYVCANVAGILREFVRSRGLGRVVSNNGGVKTDRAADTVHGPDVAFYSYARLPRGPLPPGYWHVPELVFEVKSVWDRWPALTGKAGEYLTAGVKVVCVVDPETESVAVYLEDELPRRHTFEEDLQLPEVLPEFSVKVRQFFE